MKLTLLNIQSAELHFAEIRKLIESGKVVNLSYEKASKPKTKNQTGFFFGGLASQINPYFLDCGYNCNEADVRYDLYEACSIVNPEMVRQTPFGNRRVLHIPEMDRPLMSKFISSVYHVIDNNEEYSEVQLTPDLRYNWVHHLEKEEIRQSQTSSLPDEDKMYLNYVRQKNCIVCGRRGPSEAHHWKQNITRGIGEKSPDWMAMPLCNICHHGLAHNKTDEFKHALRWIPIDMIDFLRLCYLRKTNNLM